MTSMSSDFGEKIKTPYRNVETSTLMLQLMLKLLLQLMLMLQDLCNRNDVCKVVCFMYSCYIVDVVVYVDVDVVVDVVVVDGKTQDCMYDGVDGTVGRDTA